jgi:hypothetical protein
LTDNNNNNNIHSLQVPINSIHVLGEVLVNQKLRNLETGYIERSSPQSDRFVYSGKPARDREIVQKGDTNKILHLSTAIELDIVRESNKLIRLLTSRQLSRGENEYTEEIINKNKERMFRIAKSLDKQLNFIDELDESLQILEYSIKNMNEILGQERDAAVSQKELYER